MSTVSGEMGSMQLYGMPRRPVESLARLVVLGFITTGLFTGHARASLHGTGLAITVLAAVCVTGWLGWSAGTWMIPDAAIPRTALGSVLVIGVAGAVLTGIAPATTAVAFPASAALVVAVRSRAALAVPWVVSLIAIVYLTSAITGHLDYGFGYAALIFGLFGVGLGRRSYCLRAETAERLLVERERFNAERAHAAALAERGRIAREIHDVLAHSLSALTVQLEAADALLTGGRDLERAHSHVNTAQRIAREGLAETRRAIAALREDTPPLRALLKALADSYTADSGAQATVLIEAEPECVPTDAALAIYRTAQESLTNVRKHAPGANVGITLESTASEVVLTITNCASDGESPLATSGGGYGLTGLHERAKLAGGSLEAGPLDGGWRVKLTVPAQSPPTLGA
jgi:signal transduction histidine kinase